MTAKLLQSCLTLCDPRDGSPPGSPVPGILQARILEWGAIAFFDISDYELAFPEMAWGVGYLTHLCFHLHLIKPTKAEWTLKVKEETVLDDEVF